MILELYIIIVLLMVGFFLTAYFTKQEIIWFFSLLFSGIVMLGSYNVQIKQLVYDETKDVVVQQFISHSFPFMMSIGLLFFTLTVLLTILDLFDKYSISLIEYKGGKK